MKENLLDLCGSGVCFQENGGSFPCVRVTRATRGYPEGLSSNRVSMIAAVMETRHRGD
jgi:hypothetical protein